ncbi:MAG TPA: carboxypeptidase regulatory-like domain-containing protein [Pyrinomonadaceae bacterium]
MFEAMRMKRYAFLRAALSATLLFAALAGGARGLTGTHATRPQERTLYIPKGQEGMIEGVVTVEGNVPPKPSPSMAADPVCASLNKSGAPFEEIAVERGKLANVLVYVESAVLDSYMFELRSWMPALGSRRCRIAPRVLAMQAGQTLYFQNNDRTHHNPAFLTKVNPLFNKGLSPGDSFEVLLQRPEPPFVVTCRQHPWERGYVAVMSHPFFAVTGRNGYFAIEGLPPGDYEVVVWHEKFAEARAKVSVGARESKVASFTFKYPSDVR